MATSYTAKQLTLLREVLTQARPPNPPTALWENAPRAVALSASSSEEGIVVSILRDDQSVENLFLNPVVAVELARKIIEAGDAFEWWNGDGSLLARESK